MSRSGSNLVLFKCIKCDEYFKSVTALSVHNVSHQEAAVFRCIKCNIAFPHLSLLEKHFSRVHRPYSCYVCGLSFAEWKTMSRHMFQTHLNIIGNRRDDGNIDSKRKKIHIYKHTSDVNKLVFLSDNPTETPENNVESNEVEIGRKDDHSYAKRYEDHPKECTDRRENFTSPELLGRHIKTEHMSDVNKLAFWRENPTKTPDNNVENCEVKIEGKGENNAEIPPVRSANDTEIKEKNCTTETVIPKEKSESNIVWFKCLRCDKCYDSMTELSVHIDSHQEDPGYKCTTCGFCFMHQSLLTNHLKEAHGQVSPDGLLEDQMNEDVGKTPNHCPVCGLSFSDRKTMSLHKCRTTKKEFVCGDCGLLYTNISSLRTHVLAQHMKSLPFLCEKCGKDFKYKGDLKIHVLHMHTDIRLFICKNPAKTTENSVEKDDDMEIGGKGENDAVISAVKSANDIESNIVWFKCLRCDESFKSMTELSVHSVIHQEDAVYKCVKCGLFFKHISILTNHFNEAHVMHKCDECEKCFASRLILNLHMKTHRPVEPLLEDHINTHLHKCINQKCDCKNATNLSVNQANTPTSKVRQEQGKIYVERQKLCSDGGETFTTWNLLQKHQAEHPYKCGLCQSRFKHTYELQLHQLRVHEDDKPFKCGGCGMCFASVQIQSRHMKTHLALKCGHIGCTQAFCTRSQLNQHQEIHFSVQLDKSGNSSADADESKQYPCLYCRERFVTFAEAQTHIKSHGELQLEPVQIKSETNMINVDFNSSVLDKNVNVDCDIKPHSCLQCHLGFSTESDFDAHMKTHMDCFHSVSADEQNLMDCKKEGSKYFPCLQCNKCYSTSSDLETHKKVHNDSESMSDLDYLHLNNERPMDFDDDRQPYPCLACHKTFTSNSDLGIHMKTHINVKSEDSCFVNGELNVRF